MIQIPRLERTISTGIFRAGNTTKYRKIVDSRAQKDYKTQLRP